MNAPQRPGAVIGPVTPEQIERLAQAITPWTCGSMLDGRDNSIGQGKTINLVSGATAPQNVQLFRAHAPQGSNTHLATVNLGVTIDGSDLGSAVERRVPLVANVFWGTGEANYQAFVDFHNGSQFTVAASFLEIAALFVPLADDGNGILRAKIEAGAAWGTRPAGAKPTLTLRTLIQGGASAILAVPPFAESFNVYPSSSAAIAATTTVRVKGGPLTTDATILEYTLAQEFDPSSQGTHLSGLGRAVEISNTSGVAVNYTVPFFLGL